VFTDDDGTARDIGQQPGHGMVDHDTVNRHHGPRVHHHVPDDHDTVNQHHGPGVHHHVVDDSRYQHHDHVVHDHLDDDHIDDDHYVTADHAFGRP
jgi:hypothetical protein